MSEASALAENGVPLVGRGTRPVLRKVDWPTVDLETVYLEISNFCDMAESVAELFPDMVPGVRTNILAGLQQLADRSYASSKESLVHSADEYKAIATIRDVINKYPSDTEVLSSVCIVLFHLAAADEIKLDIDGSGINTLLQRHIMRLVNVPLALAFLKQWSRTKAFPPDSDGKIITAKELQFISSMLREPYVTEPDVCFQLLRAILTMSRTESNVDKLIETQFLQALLKLIKLHISAPRVQAVCFDVLNKMNKLAESARVEFADVEGRTHMVLLTMRTHRDDGHVQGSAGLTLAWLVNERLAAEADLLDRRAAILRARQRAAREANVSASKSRQKTSPKRATAGKRSPTRASAAAGGVRSSEKITSGDSMDEGLPDVRELGVSPVAIIRDHGGLEHFLASLEKFPDVPDVLGSAMAILKLLLADDEARYRFHSMGGATRLIRAVRDHYSNVMVVQQALDMLGVLCKPVRGWVLMNRVASPAACIYGLNCVETACKAMKDYSDVGEIVTAALYCISQVSVYHVGCRAKMYADGIGQAVAEAMEAQPWQISAQEHGLRTLGMLAAAEGGDVGRKMIADGMPATIVTAMNRHPSKANVEAAGKEALWTLALLDDNVLQTYQLLVHGEHGGIVIAPQPKWNSKVEKPEDARGGAGAGAGEAVAGKGREAGADDGTGHATKISGEEGFDGNRGSEDGSDQRPGKDQEDMEEKG